MPSRRLVLTALAAAPVLPLAARAQGTGAGGADKVPERAFGNPDAKVVVQEWFSLTCSHCAEFQKTTFPQVKAQLIDTGKIRYVFRDYPLDQVALTAAAVARALPAERYEPFITTLLATQDRWAFARGVNSVEEIAKVAALAGMPRAAFDAAANDTAVKQAILNAQNEAEKRFNINSTPSFLFNGKMVPGAIPFPTFQQQVDLAGA